MNALLRGLPSVEEGNAFAGSLPGEASLPFANIEKAT